MGLALFDLDNTLIGGDSDYLWGCYLVEQGIVDGEAYEAANQRFYDEYRVGKLDIQEFLAFSLRPLADNRMADLLRWRTAFVEEKIRPIMLQKARNLVESHRRQGDTLLIITATNRFVTEPIAALFGIDHLLATEPEVQGDAYTGRVAGIPCFQSGKIDALEHWMSLHDASLDDSTFYSDSHNDLPLLERVTRPVAVDPDEILDSHARRHSWQVLSLR